MKYYYIFYTGFIHSTVEQQVIKQYQLKHISIFCQILLCRFLLQIYHRAPICNVCVPHTRVYMRTLSACRAHQQQHTSVANFSSSSPANTYPHYPHHQTRGAGMRVLPNRCHTSPPPPLSFIPTHKTHSSTQHNTHTETSQLASTFADRRRCRPRRCCNVDVVVLDSFQKHTVRVCARYALLPCPPHRV